MREQTTDKLLLELFPSNLNSSWCQRKRWHHLP